MSDIEFKENDVVTVDRYNHIDDVQKGTVLGFDVWNDKIIYKIDIDGVTITTSGLCIMESKYYEPLPANERHAKREPYISREERIARYIKVFSK
jgi:hypothetical protein